MIKNRFHLIVVSVIMFSFIILGVQSCSNGTNNDKRSETSIKDTDSIALEKISTASEIKNVDSSVAKEKTTAHNNVPASKSDKKKATVAHKKQEGNKSINKKGTTTPTAKEPETKVSDHTAKEPIVKTEDKTNKTNTTSIESRAKNTDSTPTVEKLTPQVKPVAKIQPSKKVVTRTAKTPKTSPKGKPLYKIVPTTVKDADSNSYSIIVIGKQSWMGENLKTTHYANGKKIANVKDSSRWTVFNSGAYCSYNNDSLNVKQYGYLYNWFAVNDSQKICPKGWHIPSETDWNVLEESIGGTKIAGGKMKDTITSYWTNSYGNTNESGFNGLPSGCRTSKGTFNSIGYYGLWWTATENYSNYAWYRSINYNSTDLFRHYYYKRYGFSVRCVKND